MEMPRHARLFKNGRSQAIRIPKEFELPGHEAVIRKEGKRLIIEPLAKKPGLLELLASFEPIEDSFADIDDLPPADDVDL